MLSSKPGIAFAPSPQQDVHLSTEPRRHTKYEWIFTIM